MITYPAVEGVMGAQKKLNSEFHVGNIITTQQYCGKSLCVVV